MASCVSIDWLSFTFRVEVWSDVDEVLQCLSIVLGEKNIVISEGSGLRGYNHGSLVLDGLGFVGVDPDRLSIQGLHVSLPGQALAMVFERFPRMDMEVFLSKILNCSQHLKFVDIDDDGVVVASERPNCVITRCDVAFDDKDGEIDLCEFQRLCTERSNGDNRIYTSRFRKNPELFMSLADGGGKTIYFGSKQSDTQLRIYDKLAEVTMRGTRDFEGLTHWVRVELVVRRDRAMGLALEMISRGVGAASEYLLSYLDFKDLSEVEDTNLSRVPTASWWSTFLMCSDKLLLSFPTQIRTVEKVVDWVSSQVGPSLSVLVSAFGTDGVIADIIKASADRMSESQLSMIGRFREIYQMDVVNDLGSDFSLSWSDFTERLRYEQLKYIPRVLGVPPIGTAIRDMFDMRDAPVKAVGVNPLVLESKLASILFLSSAISLGQVDYSSV